MKTIELIIPMVVGLTCSLSLYGQGSLTPPGAPAPTMKTLQQIEPRTPISSLPFIITNSGAYYLTTNLTSPSGQNGIIVSNNNVTIDLNGFTIFSGGGFGSGIFVPSLQFNISVQNGTVRGFGDYAIRAINAANSQFDDVKVSNNGIGFLSGSNCVIKSCLSTGNFSDGFQSNPGTTVVGCVARQNGDDGFDMSGEATMLDCTSTANGNRGFAGNNDLNLNRCTAVSNGGQGFLFATNCIAKDCLASKNTGGGIKFATDCQVVGNNASDNGGVGIEATGLRNRIDSNQANKNAVSGIKISLENAQNLIVRNMACESGIDFDIPSGNKYGPIEDLVGVITSATGWENFRTFFIP